MDTYKVATTANSCSTMHKLHARPITINDFEMDDYSPLDRANDKTWEIIIDICEQLRLKYVETKDKRYWKELIRILPEAYLQKRTWTADYCTLRHIWMWRHNHKLTEWHTFCKAIEDYVPYAHELILYQNGPDGIAENCRENLTKLVNQD